ncbi:putative DNA ligase [Caenibius tardaugens NBRC 16725]|uniref:DNA ligase (ATP) n=1 Tax=Caenibius tardaugens NBRC 16725 TaxID=1219035 RepID=U3A819_9SPHN|nr:DNA ligase D [Caenibius tardaugens]AZI36313.1 DNA ligase D [Caenibius tardaugens NBRC 16725]GAD50898.1 putative DNA ligase [Caenibius tardaugens NBRC 16725]
MASADPLSRYNEKRDFTRTSEPAGKTGRSTDGNLFIVQKHGATRLHWDFRLEADGVLKSWAITKGPSTDPDDKRLAVRTEDHPLSYARFEGTIPKGEYGGGTVMLWDQGTWEPVEGKSAKDIEKGHLHFRLHGERMKGEWLLVRMRPRPGEKRENWLLRKIADAYASNSADLVEQGLTSVLTGRSMAQIAADKAGTHPLQNKKGKDFDAAMKKAARHNAGLRPKTARTRKDASSALPTFQPVQLATLVDTIPTGNGWMHEIKFDGYRALVAASSSKVRIYTRSSLDWTDKFEPLAQQIAALDLPPCLIDGEIVAYDSQGNPDFSALQNVLKRGHGQQQEKDHLAFHAFDLLLQDGLDLKPLPAIERKERLEALLADSRPPVHVADHVIGAGEKLFSAMCVAGQEGIIAKRVDAPYRGERTRNWVKVKCTRRQEFVIIGWTTSGTRGRAFKSLLLAQREGDVLVYKGKVGTGFNSATMDDLANRIATLTRKTAPAPVPRAEARGAHWVTPKLVAEVAFAEFTAEGRVRHGSFIALRTDKTAQEVKPERALAAPQETAAIRITHPDRVIFPETGETKGDLATYYESIAPLMLPFAAHRPISLVRCPQGRARKCFFQKHDSGSFGPHVSHVPIAEKHGGVEDYLYVTDTAGLLACVQMGTIEFHGWCASTADVEHPDRMIFDLDPDEGLDFAEVKRAARQIRQHLADLGLVSFAMLSGGKGVHVVLPLTPGHDWAVHKDFAKRFAEALSIAEPERFTATMSKAKRKGRIFIDWLRNQRGGTAILPYSARARTGAPIAVPVGWDELKDIETANSFSIRDAADLLERSRSKPLRGWGFAAQSLPETI